jgi:UDP-N-acetylmuramyl pentapeptide phosphotransferase/UDP-N-acetylglucosamine-1-phosphate transferase
MLRWALSPLGALLYTGMLAATLLLAGIDPGSTRFWLPLAIFLVVIGFYDISAYVVQRRRRLSAAQVADAVLERLWPSPEEGGDQ